MLDEIKRLKELNTDFLVKAMLKGDRVALDYSHGFDDALTNLEWFILAKNKSREERKKN